MFNLNTSTTATTTATATSTTIPSATPTPPVLANPRILWFRTQWPPTLSIVDRLEWQEALRLYLRGLGLVVHQEGGFGVALPIGRDLQPVDRREIAEFARDFGEGTTIELSDAHPVEDLLDCCEALVRRSEPAHDHGLRLQGLHMVLLVVTRALLQWRQETDALQRLH